MDESSEKVVNQGVSGNLPGICVFVRAPSLKTGPIETEAETSGSLFLCQSEYVISCGTSVNAAGREEKTPEFRHRCKAINENRKVGIK